MQIDKIVFTFNQQQYFFIQLYFMRIAGFNTENLFTRAKVLNFKSNADGDQILSKISILQSELEKNIYDKTLIMKLYKELKDFIEITEERGKLFKRKGFSILGLQANGIDDWDGSIQFKRDRFSDAARGNTARVLQKMNADVQCLVEVENREVLDQFNVDLLGSKKFPYNMLIDGNDPRGIDVGLLSRYPIKNIRTHIFDKEKPKSKSFIFSRDCLELELEFSKTQSLHVLCNHFKSKGYSSSQKSADARRALQANRVKLLLKNYDLAKDWVIVLGDFNDTPGSKPLQSLLSTQNLWDVLQLKFGADMEMRYTYFYKQKLQLDYLLVSKPLKEAFKDAGVERGGMFAISEISKGVEKSFATVTNPSNAASDHAGVWAEFSV